jgi:predicted RNase H-like HicB family nuclease
MPKLPSIQEIKHTKIKLSIILVEDPNLGGYTSFISEYSNIVAQGETKTEAVIAILGAFHDVIKNGFIKFDE